MKEAKNINKSLSALQGVIESLSRRKKFVSYKDSLLTLVLRDSLGGNCKTTLLIAASPNIYNRAETINSLNFGKRCKMIKNKVSVNLEMTKKQLREQIEKLQQQLAEIKQAKTEQASDIVKGELAKQVEENKLLQAKLKAIEENSNSNDDELVKVNAEVACYSVSA